MCVSFTIVICLLRLPPSNFHPSFLSFPSILPPIQYKPGTRKHPVSDIQSWLSSANRSITPKSACPLSKKPPSFFRPSSSTFQYIYIGIIQIRSPHPDISPFLTNPLSFLSPRTATKVGAIVGGQTSVKAPEKAAFEKYLPEDVQIVSCHSLHGPTVSPLGQPLVSIQRTICLVLSPSITSPFSTLSPPFPDHSFVRAN